jgi:glucuronosyltransferase
LSNAQSALGSRRYGFNPDLPQERRRLVLTISPTHWAAEWLRPVTPNYKLVGPVLAGPGRPLAADLEVGIYLSCDLL